MFTDKAERKTLKGMADKSCTIFEKDLVEDGQSKVQTVERDYKYCG